MTSRNHDGADYFSDPVKLVHTAEDRTFITDERFIDAEIIDLGDILSPEEDSDYDPPQKTQTPVPTPVKISDSCGNRYLNPSVTLVDFCKRPSKHKSHTRHSDTKVLKNRPKKVKYQGQKSEDSKTDSDIEIIDQTDTIVSKKSKETKAYKNNLTHQNHEMEIQKAIEQRSIGKIVDIKKNTGLIGMKIKRSNVDLDKNFGKGSIENTRNEQKTTHKIEKLSKNSRNKHKVKTKTNSKKKNEKETLQSQFKKYTTEGIENKKDLCFRKHPKEDLPENIDKFDKEKKTDRAVSKPPISISPKKIWRDVEKSSQKNVYENDTKKVKKARSIWSLSLEDKKDNQSDLKQKSILEKYTNLKENGAKCGSKIFARKNSKENDKNEEDNEQSNAMKVMAEQSNVIMNNVGEQRSFPTLNTFTKNVIKKVLKGGMIPSSTNTVKSNKEEQHIRSNNNLYTKENTTLPNKKVPQMCKDVELDIKTKSDTAFKDNNDLNNMKTDSVNKLFRSPKQNANLELSLRGDQNRIANDWNMQSHNYTPSSLEQSIHMNAKKFPVVKLPFPYPSISSYTSLVSPKTSIQLPHNILNNNNVKESQREKIVSVQSLGRIEDNKNQKQPIPEAIESGPFSNTFQSTNQLFPILPLVSNRNDIENPRHDIAFQYNKPPPQIPQMQKQPTQNEKVDMSKPPPPPIYGNVVQKFHCMHQRFPDCRMMKKTQLNAQPDDMNILYRPPPPNAHPPYQYYYPTTMPRVPDNPGMYSVINQNYSRRVGPYMLPYNTDIFPHPPPLPPPPPPPPPTLPPASQQPLQQTFPNTNQLTTQNSIIGRNNDGVIKKINIPAPPSTKPEVSNAQVDSKEGIAKIENITENTPHYSKNLNEAVATAPPAVTKSELLKELDSDIQTNNITVFTHNLKRQFTSQFPIQEKNKNNKPCPLSKKMKVSDSRILPNKEQINEEPVTKGYSPPILPIPTFENILSQIHAHNIGSIPNRIMEKPDNKNMVIPPQQYHHTEVRKISLDEYKKKSFIPSGKTNDNNYRRL